MAKKNFFIKPSDTHNKRKSLEHFDKDESKIFGDIILGGWRESLRSQTNENDIEEEKDASKDITD